MPVYMLIFIMFCVTHRDFFFNYAATTGMFSAGEHNNFTGLL